MCEVNSLKVQGVLDRIEDNKFGVILVEELKKEFVIPKEKLPKGINDGAWLSLVIDSNDEIQSIEINQEKTDQVQQRINVKLDRIRKKSTGSKFKRK
jgi:hypothetical protein